ncbi:MAG: PDZ domain-containing protein, partial [Planctomycetota bacterium]
MRTLAVLIVAAGIATAQETAKEGAPGFLGVHVGELHAETRALFPEIPKDLTSGAVLTEIVKGSPAEAAGFRKGDVVTWFDGKEIENHEALFAAVQAKRAGDKVAYRLRRGTGKIEGWLTLGRRPEPAIEIVPVPMPVPVPEPERPAPHRGLKDRLDRLDKDVGELRERLLKARKRAAPLRHPRSVGGWAHREEQMANAARKRGDMD